MIDTSENKRSPIIHNHNSAHIFIDQAIYLQIYDLLIEFYNITTSNSAKEVKQE
jgi:hypothetical protein